MVARGGAGNAFHHGCHPEEDAHDEADDPPAAEDTKARRMEARYPAMFAAVGVMAVYLVVLIMQSDIGTKYATKVSGIGTGTQVC